MSLTTVNHRGKSSFFCLNLKCGTCQFDIISANHWKFHVVLSILISGLLELGCYGCDSFRSMSIYAWLFGGIFSYFYFGFPFHLINPVHSHGIDLPDMALWSKYYLESRILSDKVFLNIITSKSAHHQLFPVLEPLKKHSLMSLILTSIFTLPPFEMIVWFNWR